MASASKLIDTIRTELKPLHQKIIDHRYVAALESGQVPRESLAVFAIQQHHIIASDLRSIALLLARHGNLPSRPYLFNILLGENNAFEALTKFAQAWGSVSRPYAARNRSPWRSPIAHFSLGWRCTARMRK